MPSILERQISNEIESVVMGRTRYEERRRENGESATSPGEEQTRRALPALASALEEFMCSESTAGRRLARAMPYLVNIAPIEAAYLTIRLAMDGASAGHTANNVAITIGNAVQDHVNLMNMASGEDSEDDENKKHMKRLFKKVMEQVKKATTASHRQGVWRHVLAKYRPQSLDWSKEAKLHVGMKLLELLESSSNLIRVQTTSEGHNNTPVRVVFTDEAAAWMETAHMTASLWQPVHQPMLVPPADWTNPFNGGYVSEAIKLKLVLSHSRGYLDELRNVDMPEVYAAVNAVQRTPWRVNKAVLDVMREARGLGEKFRALFVETAGAEPMRPAGIPEDLPVSEMSINQREELAEWRKRKAMYYASKARANSSVVSCANKMAVAQKFVGEEAIYFPHQLDFRGRIYPLASYLNPQGDDMARGLLQFAQGKPLGARGAYWLKVHIANLFGVDKVSFEERVAWVDKCAEHLLQCAVQPLDCEWWTTADSPWQALAACFEFAGYMVQGEDYVSHLPIAMDGSCSGLQHFSAMLLDEEGGRQVNLVPSDKPADIYTKVAQRAQSVCDTSTNDDYRHWRGGKVNRKIAKQPTMTYCYSATQFGMAAQIGDAVRKLGVEYLEGVEDIRSETVKMAKLIRESIRDTVKAAAHAMDFLREVAVAAAEKGLPIRWTAPSGLPVIQEYKTPIGKHVNVMYQGVRLRLIVQKEGTQIDKKRQAAGVAPNFVHSCDSAHLMGTVNLGVANELLDWACIHDSFGVHAADVDTLHACIRESFIEQYTPDVLRRFRDEVVEQLQQTAPELIEGLADVPPRGTLDLGAIRESRYFFA
jgi:Mitochondrial DNA-directed RNA polymerase